MKISANTAVDKGNVNQDVCNSLVATMEFTSEDKTFH